ncbi:MAG: hypothetical protein LBT53_08690 [Puniceicoccales bacterium]|jgi:hypothetical protein|nr:hypothetical protein [Puniceicoccales bacterium]
MTEEEKNEKMFRAWRGEGRKPDGHAPDFAVSNAAFYCFHDGDPRLEEARATYDEHYFRAHPEEREKYGYKGP